MPTPRSWAGTAWTIRSSKKISPSSGRSRPATSRASVVLPAPEGPSTYVISPGRSSNEAPSTAATPA